MEESIEPESQNSLRRAFQRILKFKESKGALLLLVATVVTAVLGFLREAVFAYFFGMSEQLDAFLIALTVPKLLVALVSTVSISVLLPAYVRRLEREEFDRATDLARSWVFALGGILVAIAIILGIFPKALISVLAPGLNPEQEVWAVGWLRLLLPYLVILGLAGALKVVLDSHKLYAYPAFGNAIVVAVTIVVCLLTARKYGVGALTWGFVFGAIAAFSFQWLQAIKVEPGLKSVRVTREDILGLPWAPLGWVLIQTLSTQLYIIFDRGFASTLPPGNISAMNYAAAAMNAPLVATTAVLATVLFPIMAAMAARNEWRRAFKMTAKWVGVVVVAGGIGAIAIFVFRVEFVDLLFGRGAFDEEAIAVTGSIVGILSVTIITAGCSPMLNRLLLSFRRFRAVAFLALLTTGVKLLLNYLLIGPYGVLGLAMGTVGAATLGTLIRFGLAWRVAYTHQV